MAKNVIKKVDSGALKTDVQNVDNQSNTIDTNTVKGKKKVKINPKKSTVKKGLTEAELHENSMRMVDLDTLIYEGKDEKIKINAVVSEIKLNKVWYEEVKANVEPGESLEMALDRFAKYYIQEVLTPADEKPVTFEKFIKAVKSGIAFFEKNFLDDVAYEKTMNKLSNDLGYSEDELKALFEKASLFIEKIGKQTMDYLENSGIVPRNKDSFQLAGIELSPQEKYLDKEYPSLPPKHKKYILTTLKSFSKEGIIGENLSKQDKKYIDDYIKQIEHLLG